MREIGSYRELWKERTGGFYPLLVAAQAQTRLPIANTLVPSEEDLQLSLRWLPVVGFAIGVLWAFVAATCVALGLASLPTATIVVAAMVLGGGGIWELALSQTTEDALARWRMKVQQTSARDDALLVAIVVVTLSIAFRVACLSVLAADDFTATLLAAAVLSRWTLSIVPLCAAFQQDRSAIERGTWLRYGGLALAVAMTMGLCEGAGGIVLMTFAGATIYLVSKRGSERGLQARMRSAAALALALELIVFL